MAIPSFEKGPGGSPDIDISPEAVEALVDSAYFPQDTADFIKALRTALTGAEHERDIWKGRVLDAQRQVLEEQQRTSNLAAMVAEIRLEVAECRDAFDAIVAVRNAERR